MSFVYTLGIVFIYFLVLLVSDRHCLDDADFNNMQDHEAETFEQQAGKKASVLDHVELMLSPPLVTL
jgi:hypothetical protein